MELLDSLNFHETRLLLVHCARGTAASEPQECLYAVIAPARVGCISHGDCRRELAAIQDALLRILRSACAGHERRVCCVVDLDLHEAFSATPRYLIENCADWVMR